VLALIVVRNPAIAVFSGATVFRYAARASALVKAAGTVAIPACVVVAAPAAVVVLAADAPQPLAATITNTPQTSVAAHRILTAVRIHAPWARARLPPGGSIRARAHFWCHVNVTRSAPADARA